MFLQSHLRLTGVNDIMDSVYSDWVIGWSSWTYDDSAQDVITAWVPYHHQVLPAVSIGDTTITTSHTHTPCPHLLWLLLILTQGIFPLNFSYSVNRIFLYYLMWFFFLFMVIDALIRKPAMYPSSCTLSFLIKNQISNSYCMLIQYIWPKQQN